MREEQNISPGGTARFVGDLPTKQTINKNVNAARINRFAFTTRRKVRAPLSRF